MMRTENLWKLANTYGLKFITIKELQDYCRLHEKHVNCEAVAKMPTKYGDFTIHGYVNDITGEHHVHWSKVRSGGRKCALPGTF